MQNQQTDLSGADFKMVAKTLYGLEDVLAEELRALHASDVETGRRMVSFRGNKELLYRANVQLRTALRVLKPIYTFQATDADRVYEQMKRFDWSSVMTSSTTFAIDTVIYSDFFSHSAFVGYRAKDAIVDYFREREDTRPSVRLNNPDLLINLHISHNQVTLSLDSSGESLHKRGYRVVQTPAPLNEVLAAGILLKAGWKGETDLIDPMCGSGTFLIEAALIATGTAPGIFRKSFAFEQWPDFDADLFNRVYNDDSGERAFDHVIYGSDILQEAIRAAEANIRQAGMSRHIRLSVMPLQESEPVAAPALVVMNPPYGERLRMNDAQELYGMIGSKLKHNFSGCNAWIIGYKPEHFEAIGLKHSFREKVMNGALECELRSYELFTGSRKDFKTQEQKPPFRKEANRPERGERRGRKTANRNEWKGRNSRREERFDKRCSPDLHSKDSNTPQARDAVEDKRWPRDRFKKTGNRSDEREEKPFQKRTGRFERDEHRNMPRDRFERSRTTQREQSKPRYQVFRADDENNNTK